MIECKINGKRYVGASNDVGSRISQHFSLRTCNLYPSNPLYQDIKKYGRVEFDTKLLEQTTEETKLEREQYWYDKLNPEYNFVRPTECMLTHPKVRAKTIKASKNPELAEMRKKLYNTEKYQKFFKTCHPKIKPVEMYKDDELIKIFVSVRSCARWLDENTKFKSKNKASKVIEVCKGGRKKAFGYTFKYSTESVETILGGSRPSIDTMAEEVN